MSDDKQVNIMEGPAQVGTGNTQINNPTTNNNTTTNNNSTTNNTTNSGFNIHFHQTNYHIYHGNAPEPVAQHSTTSQLLSRDQLLQLQQVCQTGLVTEHTVQQVTDVMARQQPTEQPSPSCDECRIRTRPHCLTCLSRTAPASTETAECVRLVDKMEQELQPGDGVYVLPDGGLSEYCGVYVGGRELIRCDRKTQEVKMEMMDIKRPFYRMTPDSGRCKIFPAETRLDRARSQVGKVSPVETGRWGLDFVCWTFTGLNHVQAGKKGFWLL